MSNCRVLHLIQGLAVGGMEKGTLQLARLARQHGFDDRIVTYDTPVSPSSTVSDLGGVPVAFEKRRPGFDFAFAMRLRRILSDWNVRVLHAHNDTALFYGALAIQLSGNSRPRLVATYHNAPTHTTWRARLAARWAAKKASFVAAVSSELRDRLRSGGWAEGCIAVLNGVDTDAYTLNGEVENWRARLKVPASALFIGNVARFDTNKRQSDLVEAARLLRGMISQPVALVFVGEGRTLDSVRAQAGHCRDVHFLTRVLNVAAFLRNLDLFVLCSMHEGAPRAMLEAMACGCPVVATDVGGVSEILKTDEGPCGYLVPPADPTALARGIAELYFSKHQQAKFRERARCRVVANFSAQRQWADYEALYEDALQVTGMENWWRPIRRLSDCGSRKIHRY